MRLDRRRFLAGSAALGAVGLGIRPAWAKGSVTAAVYPGSWEEAFRGIVAPALDKAHGVQLEMQALYAVDQIAKARAARGQPTFDVFVLDPGPRVSGIEAGVFDKFTPSKLTNLGAVPAGLADEWGVTVAAQVVGIAYNPKKLPPPKDWDDLLKDPWVSRLGLTGFQTTFGTVSIIEIARRFGGSETNVDPFFVEMRKVLSKVATIGTPQSMAGLYQQGQCDVLYTNTQTVSTLKGRGVDIEFVKPASGAVAFFTTMHLAKGAAEPENAYRYIDTVIGRDVQAALIQPPWNFVPVNREVALGPELPMKTLDEMAGFVRHDWTKINPLRAGWIERFNKEVAK
ncbi:putative spermidine/putrescine transport system substrate-binding protein [Stella humosa]|uniref:Putative spermidine/putrescine transport system substrate-binding protein n=1 Tax=Stella humosa TaxID=94 RepID=A0A3N1KYX9_9PROT|nr:extracellular solute-binding protein [Stella humosa]ROP83528.1 putative spermidine/putrescine transport system substrate-binding protein [Stella humosa]BBK33199.1 ABC transporter substrate-binding protein [Stella humosa]